MVDALHQGAALLWTGTLIAVVFTLASRGAVLRAILRPFSAVAVASVVVLALTGLLLVGRGVATVDALLLSDYGRVLLVKIGIGLAVGAVGLFNSVLLHRKAALTGRTVALEAVLGALLLGAAATLGSAAPATGPQWQAAPVATKTDMTADDLVETVDVTPNVPGGANFVSVRVLETRRPAPAPIGQVRVDLRADDGTVLGDTAQPAAGGTYVLPTARLAAGTWHVTVTVSRKGVPAAVADTDWVVPGATASPEVVSTAPLAPLTEVGAGLLAVGGLTGLALWLLRRRRRLSRGAPSVEEISERQPERVAL